MAKSKGKQADQASIHGALYSVNVYAESDQAERDRRTWPSRDKKQQKGGKR